MLRFAKSALLSTILAMSIGTAEAATIVDTGSNVNGTGWNFNTSQYFAGRFTLAEDTLITSLEGFLFIFSSGTGTVKAQILDTTAGGAPGSVAFSQDFTVTTTTGAWFGVSGNLTNLVAGTYWAALVPQGSINGRWLGGAPNPMEEYAQGNSSSGWSYAPNVYDFLDVGLRISGTEVVEPPPPAVPLPAGGLLLLSGLGLLALRRKR